jgi:hypothetical protein
MVRELVRGGAEQAGTNVWSRPLGVVQKPANAGQRIKAAGCLCQGAVSGVLDEATTTPRRAVNHHHHGQTDTDVLKGVRSRSCTFPSILTFDTFS